MRRIFFALILLLTLPLACQLLEPLEQINPFQRAEKKDLRWVLLLLLGGGGNSSSTGCTGSSKMIICVPAGIAQ